MRQRGATQVLHGGAFQPPTFEQRGAAVPFTTPSLALSRVRPDERHDLVLLLPAFAGGEGSYVVPWKAVPEVAPMSLHDRALHEEIEQSRAVTPGLLRQCALKVAKTGLAGPAAAAAAREAIEAEELKVVETHYLLIVALLESLGAGGGELLRLESASGGWRSQARSLLAEAGGKFGIGTAELFARAGALARVMAPVGLRAAPNPGRLRRLLRCLDSFGEGISAWSQTDPSELASSAAFAGRLARYTAAIAGRVVRQLDESTGQVGWMLRDWQRQAAVTAHVAGRLSWLLDGWDYATALWDEALDAPVEIQRETVAMLMPILPMIPGNEASAKSGEAPGVLPGPRPMFQQSGDWRAARADFELTMRLEAAKARAVPR